MKLFTWLKSKFNATPAVPKPAAVLPDARLYVGNGRWPFVVRIVGADAVMQPAAGRKMIATWFGGDNDPMDSGETASGVFTKGNPNIQGCALPMNYTPACAGSPLPKIRWRTAVEVETEFGTVVIPVIDVGPNKRTGNSVDLTLAVFRRLAPLKQGTINVRSVTIIGGAKYFV